MFWNCYEGFKIFNVYFQFVFAAVTIVFDQTSYTVSEDESSLEVCAVIMSLMGNLDCDLVVTFSELPDTAGITIRFCYSMIVRNELNINMRGRYVFAF